MITAKEALQKLMDGNARFVSGVRSINTIAAQSNLSEYTKGQAPFAVILGCSDSRVPVEIVFDQGLGDLFVIRIAGNVVASSQIGSIEFAVAKFGTPLVVVMGHTMCGAIQATLEELQRPSENQSKNLRSIVDRIRPSVQELLNTELKKNPEQLCAHAIRANVRMSVNALQHGSDIIENLIQKGKLVIVGAEYCLETGKVDFFENAHL